MGVIDDDGNPLSSLKIDTDSQRGPDDATDRTANAVDRAVRRAGLTPEKIVRIGLGTPGTMDVPSGMLLDPPNLPGWVNYPIRDELSRRCGLPVTFNNDAASAAYGEFWVGAGRDFYSLVLFTLGTGCGCGIVANDVTLDGEHSHGAECGHIVIDYREDARLCPCGKTGHLEAYVSAKSVVKRTLEALDGGHKSSLTGKLATGEELTALMLADEAAAGDTLAKEIVLATADYLAVGVVNLMHTVDPSGVLIGGAMTFGMHETPLGREFLLRLRQEVKRRAFPVLAERTIVDYASLGSDAGYIGAAGLARVEHRRLSAA